MDIQNTDQSLNDVTSNDNNINKEIAQDELANNDELTLVEEPIEEQEPEVIPPAEITIKVSSDNIMAYIKVKVDSFKQEVTPEDILKVLEDSAVTYGICYDDIKEFCDRRLFYTELVAARGVQPVDGENGTLEYHFKTDDSVNLVEREDGTVNYRELGIVQNVNKGDVLCSAIPPKEGMDGTNIFGEAIEYKKGKVSDIKPGPNTVLSEDKTQLLANIDGCVELKGQLVSVNEVYVIKGDVDSSTGNIDCSGSVMIQGDVLEGFIVKAKQDVIVKGMVEGATITAGGNISISSGMNGMRKGKITAEGNITSKYIENATVECNGDLVADVLMNSTTKAGGSVILKGSKASIIGGSCEAGTMIYAAYIGTHTNVATTITVDSAELRHKLSPAGNEDIEIAKKLESKIELYELQQKDFQEKIKELSHSLSDPEAKLELKRVMTEKNKISQKTAELQKQLAEARQSANQISAYKIVALKTCFIGVRINIAYLFLNVEEDYNNTKFFADGHSLTAGQVLPSDRQ